MDYSNIKTKPASKEYQENWDKIFNRENKETTEPKKEQPDENPTVRY